MTRRSILIERFPLVSFLDICIAPWLSVLTKTIVWQWISLAKQTICRCQVHSNAAAPSAIYSALVEDVVAIDCFFDFQETAAQATVITYPLVDMSASRQPALSASQIAWTLRFAAAPSTTISRPPFPITERKRRLTRSTISLLAIPCAEIDGLLQKQDQI